MDYVDYQSVPHLAAVELCSVGMEWPASIPFTVTAEHLVDVVAAANDDPHIQAPRVKIGHTSDVDTMPGWIDPFAALGDGAPVLGRIINLRTTNDGAVLVGDFIEVPAWLAEAMPSAYPNRSGEWNFDVETPGGKRYTLICTAMALLGQALPAVQDLEDLVRVLTEGPDLAAAATRTQEVDVPAVDASVSVSVIRDRFNFDWAMSEPIDGLNTYWWWARDVRIDPAEVIADDDEGNLWRVPFSTDGEDQVTFAEPVRVRETYVDVSAAGDFSNAETLRPIYVEDRAGTVAGEQVAARRGQQVLATFTDKPEKPEPTAASRPNTEEGTMSQIDIPALRRELDLTEDQLPDDATAEQVNEVLTARAPGSEEADTPPDPNDPDSPPEGDPPEVEEEEPAAASAVQVDAETWEQTREQAAAGAQVAQEQREERRESYLSTAVKAGKFPPSRLTHYTSLYDADEEGTRSLIDGLAEGLVPVDERGSAASEADQATHERIMAGAFGVTKESR